MADLLDLFAGLDESSPAKKDKTVRKARPAGRGTAPAEAPEPARAGRRLHGARHRDSGGPGAGAAAARHVHRRHRSAGAASLACRAARQCDGRGDRRPCEPDRGRAPRRRLGVGQGQRPGHPGRSPPEVRERFGARSDPDHAALGRQVQRQGLCDIGGAARGGPLGGQRARRGTDGRGGARQAAVATELLEGPARPALWRMPGPSPTGAARCVRFRPDAEIFGAGRALRAGAASRDGADTGLPLPRRRNPLVLRRGAAGRCRHCACRRRFCTILEAWSIT